jgi:hypothetical protein
MLPAMADVIPEGIRLGIVRGISYGLFGKPDTFMPQLRELGATLVRIYVYWSQAEPEPGNYTFEVVDAFLDQLDGSDEERLAGVEAVSRLDILEQPDLFVFDVGRRGRGTLLVMWQQRDSFYGEDEPPVPFEWPWPSSSATAIDALGQIQPVEVRDGRVRLHVSLTPLFVTAD